MTLAKQYDPRAAEPALQTDWDATGLHHFQADDGDRPVYAIDTPPPSVSGHLHLGHVYSYAHADFFARFRRMNGDNVFYPMGFDDNGLPTERLVERLRGVRAVEIGRAAFIRECLAVSEAAERDYEALWRRLGLSIDWRYTYRTIDEESRRIAQWGFLDLLRRGLAYRQQSPTIWCPECRTAIAQAELNDLERQTTFYTLTFGLDEGTLPVATTRPELLPACVAVFVHPDDARYRDLVGRRALVPFFGQDVPILADPAADPRKGTGAVMCCTFGDTADVAWWRAHNLPLIETIDRDGRLTDAAAPFAGLTTEDARREIAAALARRGLLLDAQPLSQTVRVHERCDTPVEYLTSQQWFIRVLDDRQAFLDAGERIAWHPAHMGARYRQWVENLSWDWCISRQRYFGVPFPLWYCADCGEPLLPDQTDLPIDPAEQQPKRPCACGGTEFRPETDVMDTWATSSLTPQIVGRWLSDPALYRRIFPMALRPQAHEIIRTWAFYTIVRSHYHAGELPWTAVAISGWGLAPEGTQKLSKSRGGGPVGPMETLDKHSADAVRYWAAGAGLGRDAVIDEDRIESGDKWVTKLWNVGRFAERFLAGYMPPAETPAGTTTADRWLLARAGQLAAAVTRAFEQYDYATARSEIETFFWRDLADNYLEMAKKRLYDGGEDEEGARFALYHGLLTMLKLLAPLLPHVTDALYRALFAATDGAASIHASAWPRLGNRFDDAAALRAGETLRDIATTVRRFKSERGLSLGAEVSALHVTGGDAALRGATADLLSITRARAVYFDGEGQVAVRIEE
ncbi:valine--tRNA ligase [Promineifilum sp.]|uniref:valine--tRNA ligase n=1 Tax=Promineifilum sp. TaxID=2664178 RepID=UPI0035B2043F